jgi:hypothetical protein
MEQLRIGVIGIVILATSTLALGGAGCESTESPPESTPRTGVETTLGLEP